jgi:hypothetical protein
VYSTGPGVFTQSGIGSLADATRQQRPWVVQASRALGLLSTTGGGSDTKLDLTHALDGFGRPLRIDDLLRRELITSDARVRRFSPPGELYQRSATTLLAFRDEDFPTASLARDATQILRAGGLVGLGGHGEMQGLQHHWELRLLTERGMPPTATLTVLAERRIGDDRESIYWLTWPGRRLRATITTGPDAKPTGILLRPDDPAP